MGNAPAISEKDIQSQSVHPPLLKERLISSPCHESSGFVTPAACSVIPVSQSPERSRGGSRGINAERFAWAVGHAGKETRPVAKSRSLRVLSCTFVQRGGSNGPMDI